MSAPLQWVLWGFFHFCLSRELIVRRDVSGISCMWRERAGMSLVLYLLSVNPVLVLPAARSRPPLACQAVLEESWVSLHCPLLPLTQQPHTHHSREVSQPWAVASVTAPCQLWKHEADPLHPVLGSHLPLPHAADQAPPALTSAIPTASGRGFLAFVFPLSQRLGRGRLFTLSEMTRGRARFRASWQRITTQANLVKDIF